MNSTLLNVQNFHLYLNQKQTLKNLCFSLKKNEIVGLVGESGSGKSLTLQSLLGLLPKKLHTTTGLIQFENQNLLLQSEKTLRQIRGKKIGFVSQDPSSALNPTLKIGTQLIESLLKSGWSKKQAYVEGTKWLEKMCINSPEVRFKQYPHELSGGMKQRIAIAMALICQPLLLLADEPTTALDVTVQAEILRLLKDLRTEKQMGIFLVTHDLGVVANCCDQVLIMRGGEILESGPVDAIFSRPQHTYTHSLLNSKQRLIPDEVLCAR